MNQFKILVSVFKFTVNKMLPIFLYSDGNDENHENKTKRKTAGRQTYAPALKEFVYT